MINYPESCCFILCDAMCNVSIMFPNVCPFEYNMEVLKHLPKVSNNLDLIQHLIYSPAIVFTRLVGFVNSDWIQRLHYSPANAFSALDKNQALEQ